MNNSMTKPLMAIIAVNFIWGLDFIIIEYMMEYVSPAVFTLSRLIIGTVVLLVLVFIKHKGLHIKKKTGREFLFPAVSEWHFTLPLKIWGQE